jgi:hypothetical protein
LKYNNKKQPFDIVGRFRILEEEGYVEYCRVRFFNTRKEQVVRAGLIATGEFEDTSLVVEGSLKGADEYTEAKTATWTVPEGTVSLSEGGVIQTATIEAEHIIDAINESPETVGEPAGEIDLSGKVEVAEEPAEALVDTDDFNVKYIATNPKGEDIEVYNLESFVAENGLDMEAVQAVLNGSQKTHRKWRFARA